MAELSTIAMTSSGLKSSSAPAALALVIPDIFFLISTRYLFRIIKLSTNKTTGNDKSAFKKSTKSFQSKEQGHIIKAAV
ncbi:hypothetical protein IC235_11100 [Hymenobacter sp. BT664]|uniref:Uncharacterized protein n=1 Tax=Hymenobacter montanus TaxID=2771359 RepID=A0A927BE89_9BACT|nr:hypothetical protein [Hymenobacter montanus]MBD2768437.1 hypothetical protein [Hymenobacter montanus]